MSHPTRQKILTLLQQDWAEYVHKFHRMPLEAQTTFLAEQGYERFADLLSHIVAWWEVGYRTVDSYLTEPSFQPRNYDVNVFNAEAVARTAECSEDEVILAFERMRLFLIDFINQLPDTAFENEKVVSQLDMELAGHLHEHRIREEE